MKTNYRNLSVLVIDLGLFLFVAETLGKHFGKVYYYTPGQEEPFPTKNHMLIGHGVPNIERVNAIYPYVDEVDLIVFPDVGFGEMTDHFRKIGKRVWGCGLAEKLELDRAWSKKHLEELGIPIGKWVKITGVDKLCEYLKTHKDVWVKTSRFRGDFETFHAPDYDLVDEKIDELRHKLGAAASLMEFIVEQAIPDAVEIGADPWTIDGKYPSANMMGIEVKDKGYVATWVPYDKQPKQILETNALIASTFRKYQAKTFWGFEMRVDKRGIPWVIDPLTRFGSPPGELCQLFYENLHEIIWEGAGGVMVKPEFAAKFGVELLIHSSWAEKNWLSVRYPDSLEPYVKLRQKAIIDGKRYIVPGITGNPEIGAVLGIGSTLKGAIEMCKKNAEQIKGYYIDIFPEALDDAVGEIAKLKTYGIEYM